MHFLLLGANGRTGQHVLQQLISNGHTVIALVRNPASLKPGTGLTIATGTPLKKSDIQNALASTPSLKPSAGIITLNTNRKSDNPFSAQVSPSRFLADSCANACEVLEQAGVRRIVMMAPCGVGDSWRNLPFITKAFLRWTNVKYAFEDHNIVDKEIRLSNMDWTLVRAVRLVYDEPVEGVGEVIPDMKTLGSAGAGMGMSDSATVSRVANFMVKTSIEGLYVKEAVVVRD